ncbi:hypothetical protein MUP77_25165 [Candidatus Bathyarchaeota archaeon]|nr:hypothetical protein [Candidatus Bathyarchaeota archaeon]
MEHERSADPDIERLKKKTQQGTRNLVTEVLKDPEVQNIIKKSVLRETVTSGLVMACLFLGLLKLFDVAKIVFNFNWVLDLAVGIALTMIGLGYMLKNLRKK